MSYLILSFWPETKKNPVRRKSNEEFSRDSMCLLLLLVTALQNVGRKCTIITHCFCIAHFKPPPTLAYHCPCSVKTQRTQAVAVGDFGFFESNCNNGTH